MAYAYAVHAYHPIPMPDSANVMPLPELWCMHMLWLLYVYPSLWHGHGYAYSMLYNLRNVETAG